jgi:predicted dehydrogenase
VLGEPDAVSARTGDHRWAGVETQFAAQPSFGDPTAQLSASFDTTDRQRWRVDATDGTLVVPEAFVPRDDDGTKLRYERDGQTVVESFDPTDQYRHEVEAFARAREGRPVPTDPESAVATLATVDACYESARRGEPVAVEH